MSERMVCVGCGEDIAEDQTALRLTADNATMVGRFSGLLLRPDPFVRAERWCATPENLRKARWELRIDATTGGTGTYRGD